MEVYSKSHAQMNVWGFQPSNLNVLTTRPRTAHKEERVELALQATAFRALVNTRPWQLGVRRPATVYKVPQTTLRPRCVERQAQRDTCRKSSSLKDIEEQALVRCIRKLHV